MRALRIALVCGVVCSGSIAHGQRSEKFDYVGWFEHLGEWIAVEMPEDRSTEGGVALGSDFVEAAEFCKPNAKHYCFRSESIAFAMPKARGALPETWEHDAIRCKLKKSNLNVTIFGQSHDGVALARCRGGMTPEHKAETHEYTFLYSRDSGLLAIGPPGASVAMWIATPKGPFGAAPGTSAARADASLEIGVLRERGPRHRWK